MLELYIEKEICLQKLPFPWVFGFTEEIYRLKKQLWVVLILLGLNIFTLQASVNG